MKFTIQDFKDAKAYKNKISMITAYDYTFGKLFDKSGVDVILVGDSLGMVQLGYNDTLPVTVDDIVYHCRSVKRGVKNAFLVGDMPFMSYNISVEDAVRNAGRIIKEGFAEAVKLEGGVEVCEQIKAIRNSKIPVMGHIGLTPQSVNVMGGYKVQGKTEEVAMKIIEDACIIEKSGAFAVVLECIPFKLAKIITESISIPTIGIGAGKYCDGQVLVYHDMFNLNLEEKKKFVKVYFDMGKQVVSEIGEYIKDVKNNNFPKDENSFKLDEGILKNLSFLDDN